MVKAVILATVLSVIDGDTIMVNFTCDVAILCKNIPLRIEHIDTPELKGKCPEEIAMAFKAKETVKAMLPVGSQLSLSKYKRDNYYRLDAEVLMVSAPLLAAGLARPYEGGGGFRKPWCK